MTTTLTDRYVHAAARWLPPRLRAEVEAELRERIGDTVAAREGHPDAEREVLEELGDPLRLATDYAGRQPALIGPRWFFPWLRLLTVLLLVVTPIVATISAVVAAFQGDPLGSIIGQTVVVLFEVAVQIAFWVTLVFAILDWTNTPSESEPWTVDQLPEDGAGVGWLELTFGLVTFAVLAGLLVWQHVGSPFVENGERIPMADPDLWSWYLPLVLVTLAMEAGHLVWVHRTGWTWSAAWANLVVTALFTIPTVVLLLQNALLNPELTAHLGWEVDAQAKVLRAIAVGTGLVGLWEIVDGFRRAASGRRGC